MRVDGIECSAALPAPGTDVIWVQLILTPDPDQRWIDALHGAETQVPLTVKGANTVPRWYAGIIQFQCGEARLEEYLEWVRERVNCTNAAVEGPDTSVLSPGLTAELAAGIRRILRDDLEAA
jgi:hypothetical protein